MSCSEKHLLHDLRLLQHEENSTLHLMEHSENECIKYFEMLQMNVDWMGNEGKEAGDFVSCFPNEENNSLKALIT